MPISHELDPESSSFNKLVEEKFYQTTSRTFYPRNFKLSEEFVAAFQKEYGRLIDEGQEPKRLHERFSKALRFHINEKKKA